MNSRDFLITEFGAVGDGITICTKAIQNTIDACRTSKGGRVIIPRGTYVTGTLFLYSCIELHFEQGSILYAADEYIHYPSIHSHIWNTEYAPRKNSRCLIYAEEAHHIAITGGGTIECHGLDWCEPSTHEERVNDYQRKTNDVIPRVLMMVGCSDFTFSDFCIHDSPAGWSVWLVGCMQGNISGIKILSNRGMPNADGLHINCCQDIMISNCRINTGDDALILRAYTSPLKAALPCERIVVTNCLLSSHSCAIRIGWCNDSIIRDCTISNCVITDSTSGVVIQLPKFQQRVADQGTDQTVVENITFSNLILQRIFFEPIHITILDPQSVKRISNIHFININSESRLPFRFNGYPEKPIENIRISNSLFQHIDQLDTCVSVPAMYWNQKAYADLPQIINVHPLHLSEVTFFW